MIDTKWLNNKEKDWEQIMYAIHDPHWVVSCEVSLINPIISIHINNKKYIGISQFIVTNTLSRIYKEILES